MAVFGGCHCGAVRYELEGRSDAIPGRLCHCSDCRRSAGAPMVAWSAFAASGLRMTKGAPKRINSSGMAWRGFCADCGTGLFYWNEVLMPGLVDVQTATLDDPGAFPPVAHLQVAERIGWMATVHELPTFERFPEHQ